MCNPSFLKKLDLRMTPMHTTLTSTIKVLRLVSYVQLFETTVTVKVKAMAYKR